MGNCTSDSGKEKDEQWLNRLRGNAFGEGPTFPKPATCRLCGAKLATPRQVILHLIDQHQVDFSPLHAKVQRWVRS